MFLARHSPSAAQTPASIITSPVGTGEKGFAGDGGPAEKAKLDQPFDVAFDKAVNLYFSDTNNYRVRKVDAKTGVISTVAGNGKKGFAGDGGKATDASLNEPYGIELDADGNLFIVDRLNFCVRKVDAKTAFITTVAGTGGKSGFGGDGGPADKALLVEPNGLCLDGKGKLYIADVAGHRVRVVDLKAGTIDTAAGNGKGASIGDGGPLKDAALLGPRAVAIGPDGKLYIVERNGQLRASRSISRRARSSASRARARMVTPATAGRRLRPPSTVRRKLTSTRMAMCLSWIPRMRRSGASTQKPASLPRSRGRAKRRRRG